MGTMTVATFFNYSIAYEGKSKEGVFRAKGYVDPSYFTKKLIMIDGYLEWRPDTVPAFTFSQDFLFEYANPNVTEE